MGCRGCGRRYGHAAGCPAKSAAAVKAAATRARRDAEAAADPRNKPDFEVGDILTGSWGYDQTNWEFYQVVAINGKKVTIREVARASNDIAWATERVYPAKDKFIGAPLVKLVSRYGTLKLHDFCSLRKWDGAGKVATHYA